MSCPAHRLAFTYDDYLEWENASHNDLNYPIEALYTDLNEPMRQITVIMPAPADSGRPCYPSRNSHPDFWLGIAGDNPQRSRTARHR